MMTNADVDVDSVGDDDDRVFVGLLSGDAVVPNFATGKPCHVATPRIKAQDNVARSKKIPITSLHPFTLRSPGERYFTLLYTYALYSPR
jgi:hypothetical protein